MSEEGENKGGLKTKVVYERKETVWGARYQ